MGFLGHIDAGDAKRDTPGTGAKRQVAGRTFPQGKLNDR